MILPLMAAAVVASRYTILGSLHFIHVYATLCLPHLESSFYVDSTALYPCVAFCKFVHINTFTTYSKCSFCVDGTAYLQAQSFFFFF